MSAIENLGITPIASSQAQKEVTANQAFERLAGAIAEKLMVAMADADVILSAAQALATASIECTGALTAGRSLIVPIARKLYDVANQTGGGFAVTVRTASGSGVAIAAGDEQIVRCDGTGVVAVAPPTSVAALAGPQPYDIASFYPGVPGSSALLLRFVAPRSVTLPQNLTAATARPARRQRRRPTSTSRWTGSRRARCALLPPARWRPSSSPARFRSPPATC
jgi:hypothetical protein